MNHNQANLTSHGADHIAAHLGSDRKRSIAASVIDWILGSDSTLQEKPTWAQTVEPEIVVTTQPNTNAWADSFLAALTEATTTFILQSVDPYFRESPENVFNLKRVKVGMREATEGCLADILMMPPDMRDGIALSRIRKAKGSEQLLLDEFYGLSLLAEETLKGGRLVETIVSYSGTRFLLKFEFLGDRVRMPSVAKTEIEEPGRPPRGHKNDGVFSESMPLEQKTQKRKGAGNQGDVRDTPLFRPAAICARDTPLYQPKAPIRSPSFRLHLHAKSSRVTVNLYEDDFPYTLGRHPETTGFIVKTRTSIDAAPVFLPTDQAAQGVCYVSREHLVFGDPDMVSKEVAVHNMAAEKNGTYLNGKVQPRRFILSAASENQTLILGGSSGEGTLEVQLEAV